MGTNKPMIRAPLFRFEAPEPSSPPVLQELQIGGARTPCVRQITTIETIF
jgi:hypothetical protein